MIKPEDYQEILPRITPQYVAGFFDGEGCVNVAIRESGQTDIQVMLSQKDPVVLHFIAMKVKGSRLRTGRTSRAYNLVWCGQNALEILNYIKDSVIIKKSQVLLGIDFCNLMNGRGNGFRPTDEQKSKRLEIAQKLKDEKVYLTDKKEEDTEEDTIPDAIN